MADKPQHTDGNSAASRDGAAKQQRAERRRRRGSSEKADWAVVDANQLLRSVVAVTGQNCAVQFGYTQDGGSFVVRIVGDGEPYNEYVRPTEDMSLFLNALSMDFEK